MKKEPKLPVQTIEIHYDSEHSEKGIRRTIFVYEGEDPNVYLSRAWRTSAKSAKIHNVTTLLATRLRPDRVEGEWVEV